MPLCPSAVSPVSALARDSSTDVVQVLRAALHYHHSRNADAALHHLRHSSSASPSLTAFDSCASLNLSASRCLSLSPPAFPFSNPRLTSPPLIVCPLSMLRTLSYSLRPQALPPLMAPRAATSLLPAVTAPRAAAAVANQGQRRLLHVSSAPLAAPEAPDHVPAAVPRADLTRQPLYMRRVFWAVIGALATVEGSFWLYMYFKDNKKDGKEHDAETEEETAGAGKQAVGKA